MSVTGMLRLAVAIAPAAGRGRLAEEWAADLAGCAELGVRRSDIVVGALRRALGIRIRGCAGALVRAFEASWAVLVGILFGAVCALGDISVLAVIAVAGVLQAPVLVMALRRRRTTADLARLRRADW